MTKERRGILKSIRVPLAALILVGILLIIPSTRHSLLSFFNLTHEKAEEGVYYTCPMHPDIRLPQPGECPICGMTLVKKEAGSEEGSGRVNVTSEQVQLTGVTVEPLKARKLVKEIDTYGSIDYDETKLGIVSSWVGGRIDKLYIDFTGVTVNKDHPLVYLYSPDLISTEKEYLLAADNLRKIGKSGIESAIENARNLVNSSKQRLLWWGLSKEQIENIERSGRVEDHITIYAPMGGTVIKKFAYEGMYVKEGDELFHIADLSRVWLYADIYEDEIPYLYQEREDDYYECPMHPEVHEKEPGNCPKCGMDMIRANRSIKVDITTRSFPGEVFKGYISFTDPFLNPATRTVRVRVNIDNSDLRLKPGMYARAKIELPVGEVLAVPENAVIHSGERKIVLVEEEKGRFRPQPVKLGRLWLIDPERASREVEKLTFQRGAIRYHEVLKGLEEGEDVVTSGNFLIGSESQLQGALAKMIEQTEEEDKEEAGSEEISYVFQDEKDMTKILDVYYEVVGNLVQDKLDGIPELAGKIENLAKSNSIKKAIEPLKHAMHKNDLKGTRKDFHALSDVLIAYLEKHKKEFKTLPYRFYCPMADASWLQKDDKTSNPYMGSLMPKCGDITPWDEK